MTAITFWTSVLIILFLTIFYLFLRKKPSKSEIFKKEYEEALAGADRLLALERGRKYYGSLRLFGTVTIYDEMAISNDINCRKNLFDK
jgi:hypothetical protein